MNNKLIQIAVSVGCLSVVACSSMSDLSPMSVFESEPTSLTPLTESVDKMAVQLFASQRFVTEKTPIAVTSFVDLANFDEVGPVGNQLAESFVYQLQSNGLRVVEYKAPGYIKVTPKGDFALSRDYTELQAKIPIDYILTGTYSKQKEGLLVNVKLFAAESRIVVATAQGLVPKSVYEQEKRAIPTRDSSGDSVRMINGQIVRVERNQSVMTHGTTKSQPQEEHDDDGEQSFWDSWVDANKKE